MGNLKRIGGWVIQNSLWVVGFGLFLASSGLDGAFLVKLMPAQWGWLGLVLNTTTDVCSEVISYWTGRLAQDANKRKREMSKLLWIPQFALVFFAWLFGWRQIIPILRVIEPDDWHWLAPLMSAFVPTALVAVGYTQALLAGKIVEEKPVHVESIKSVEKSTPITMSEEEFVRLYRAGELVPKGEQVKVVAAQMGISPRKVYRLMKANGNGHDHNAIA